MIKKRLDVMLYEKNFFPSREKAQAAIMAGAVLVNEERFVKPGTKVSDEVKVRIIDRDATYVSRGGFKLAKAIKHFSIDMNKKVVLDIGASTGGFTDCALQNGAAKVFAVDVGYGQLDWKLRNDTRVICIERTNIRYLEKEQLGELADVIVTDVSFISLEKILPAAIRLAKEDAEIVALIKPQFEAGREQVGKNGVVKNSDVHISVIHNVIEKAKSLGLQTIGLTFSPIKGPKGNVEYLVHLTRKKDVTEVNCIEAAQDIVAEAKKVLQ